MQGIGVFAFEIPRHLVEPFPVTSAGFGEKFRRLHKEFVQRIHHTLAQLFMPFNRHSMSDHPRRPRDAVRHLRALPHGEVATARRTKGNREHRVPLSRRSLEILEETRALGGGGPYVFPRVGGKPFGVTAMSELLRALRIAPLLGVVPAGRRQEAEGEVGVHVEW